MPGEGVQGKAVLFVPPDFNFENEEDALALEEEAQRQGRTDGGFLCAVSYKPLQKERSKSENGSYCFFNYRYAK